MTKIVHDRARCQSIGVCESMAPANFEFNEENEMTLLHGGMVSDEQLEQVREAVWGCPNEALSLVDDPGHRAGS
jgi:ferredoxin